MDGISQGLNATTFRYRPSFESAQALLARHRTNPSGSVLFSRGRRRSVFFTSDSKRYVSPFEADLAGRGMVRHAAVGRFDSVHVRFVHVSRAGWLGDPLYARLRREYSGFRNSLFRLPDLIAAGISPARIWNASIVTAIFFGMFSMTLIYRYLGQSASAQSLAADPDFAAVHAAPPSVLGASAEAPAKDPASDPDSYTAKLLRVAQERRDQEKSGNPDELPARRELEEEIRRMVKGTPIEKMAPYIAAKDRTVAAFMIGIAKQESGWGEHVPVLDGKDCFNYWGYRGVRARMGTGGHTCFDSPKDAVDTVAKRIETLVSREKLDTPAELVVWKCGSSCSGHSPESVRRWIRAVDMYYSELNRSGE
jgi:hypothetical protein